MERRLDLRFFRRNLIPILSIKGPSHEFDVCGIVSKGEDKILALKQKACLLSTFYI